jgi:hypothetical protein
VSLTTFKRGYIWRVGNGESIKISDDPWIPSSPDRRIISPRGASIFTKVSELISPVMGQWDEDLLRNLFGDVDVWRILQIPLNNQGFSDFMAWPLTNHGRYTVRSGYHLQWRHQFGPRAAQLALPRRSALNPVWKTILKLKIPGKVKIFIWRALHGITPVKCILANRHIGTSGACPVCSQGPEDICHLLFLCPATKEIWQSLGLDQVIEEALHVDREESSILEHLLQPRFWFPNEKKSRGGSGFPVTACNNPAFRTKRRVDSGLVCIHAS